MTGRRDLTTAVTLRDAEGHPLPHTEVTVRQLSHAFGFGNIGFDLIALANGEQPDGGGEVGSARGDLAALADLWLEVFNRATLPFYWRVFEPERGRPDTDRLQVAAEWFRARGVTVKGHPLVWHTLAPEWLLDQSTEETEAELRQRIRRDVGGLRGVVDTWDAINETVIMPVFTAEDNGITRLTHERGRLGMIRLAVEEARAANPDVVLHLNDFDLSAQYERVIEETLAAGIPIDGIGLQTHMHQGYRGEEYILEVADRFARFGLPLHFTETSLVSGDLMPPHIDDLNDYVVDRWPSTPEGEERQADEIERHYRSLVGHPAVASVTYWGITDDGAWLGAPIGLVRSDGTPKPSYDRLRALVRDEWWHEPRTLVTNAKGIVDVVGFAGSYELASRGSAATFEHRGGVVDLGTTG